MKPLGRVLTSSDRMGSSPSGLNDTCWDRWYSHSNVISALHKPRMPARISHLRTNLSWHFYQDVHWLQGQCVLLATVSPIFSLFLTPNNYVISSCTHRNTHFHDWWLFFLMPQAKKDLVLMIRITGNMSCRVLRREPWPICWDFIYRKTPPPAGWSMDAQNLIIFCIITEILKNLMWNLWIIGTTHLDKSTPLGPKASLFNIKRKNVFSFNWDQT